MREKRIVLPFLITLFAFAVQAQEIKFVEYDLPNGLHVILHQDRKAPVVAVTVSYHVGSKNEELNRTGFAHFFEHLLFEGTNNIKRGEWFKLVSGNGGQNNANTSYDRTFYYEVFPSNQLELGLWMESERMLHPVINEIGVETQNEVVKEEKRLRIDNQPYGQLIQNVFKGLFKEHPYRFPVIGSMADLDSAKLDEFKAFFKKYYVPNNAVLSIAGDLDIEQTKKWVAAYFSDIPKGEPVKQPQIKEKPIEAAVIDTAYDANIQIPASVIAFRTPGMTDADSKVLELISNYLSTGASSKLYKKLVDDKKTALQVGAFNLSLEDHGAYLLFAFPNNNTPLEELEKDIAEEVIKLQTELISEQDYQKLMNQYENDFVASKSTMLGVAEALSDGYMFHKNTGHVNEQLKAYRSITREQIREVAKKYLNSNQSYTLRYLPDSAKPTEQKAF
jgi:zinc protease